MNAHNEKRLAELKSQLEQENLRVQAWRMGDLPDDEIFQINYSRMKICSEIDAIRRDNILRAEMGLDDDDGGVRMVVNPVGMVA